VIHTWSGAAGGNCCSSGLCAIGRLWFQLVVAVNLVFWLQGQLDLSAAAVGALTSNVEPLTLVNTGRGRGREPIVASVARDTDWNAQPLRRHFLRQPQLEDLLDRFCGKLR